MRPTSSRPSALALALVTLAFAAIAAGCGTSGGSDAADDPTTTKAEATTTAASGETTTSEADDTSTTEAETTTTASSSGNDDAICAPMKALSESDAEANQLVATGDWTKIKAFYVDRTDDIVAIYDEAIALDTRSRPSSRPSAR